MRERMERLVLLPFSIGCISESSIAVGAHQHQHPRRSKSSHKSSSNIKQPDSHGRRRSWLRRRRKLMMKDVGTKDDDEDEEYEDGDGDGDGLSKPNMTIGMHKLFKGFRTLSQLFVYKDGMEEEEEEMDMEIGSPTDVKHVTHIGLDGSASAAAATASTASKTSWDDLASPISWSQFDLPRPSSQPDALNDASIHVNSVPLHEYLFKSRR